MSPEPLSLSMVQIAISNSFGTPNCRSTRASKRGVALHQARRALDAGRADARLDEFLEVALAAEGVGLAAVEAQHRLIEGEAGKGPVDDGARDAG